MDYSTELGCTKTSTQLGESTELEYTDVDAQLVSHQAEASKDMDSVDLLKLLIYGYLARLTLKNWDIMEC